jgi:hypothetical protein
MALQHFVEFVFLLLAVVFGYCYSFTAKNNGNVLRRYIKLYNTAGKGFGPPKPIKEKLIEGPIKISGIEEDKPAINETKQQIQIDPADVDAIMKESTVFKKRRERQLMNLEQNMKELREEEELIASDATVGAVPEVIADRMLGRIITFFGIPVFGGLLIFAGSVVASKMYDITIPPTIVAYATQVPFVIGLIGISYAIFSASWDEVRAMIFNIKVFELINDHI